MEVNKAIDFLDDFSTFSDYQENWSIVYEYLKSLEDDCAKMITELYDLKEGN